MANPITYFLNKVGIAPKTKERKRATSAMTSVVRLNQDAATRREAIAEAEQPLFPHRVKMQRLYLNTIENGYIKACVDRRKDLTLLRKWEFKGPNGEVDPKLTAIFCQEVDGRIMLREWFLNFLSFVLDAEFFGYSLIYLGDVVDGVVNGTEIEKRWLVSPDRKVFARYEHLTTGVNFIEDPLYKDSYVWVDTPNNLGTSCCGYGSFYEVSVYEIMLRNIMRFNADYTEVNVAPFRQVKTDKTEEDERAELYNSAVNMANNGVAVTDLDDEIIFHPSGGSGTGYQAYGDFEERIEGKVSQIILGHADAMKSIPGKLGNDGEESPAQQALEDKQSRDGDRVTALVNGVLFDRLRTMGFNIAPGSTAIMLNDNEENENANNLVDLAVKMKSAGLQMTPQHFTEKTGIPTQQETATPPSNLGKAQVEKMTNRLKELYGG